MGAFLLLSLSFRHLFTKKECRNDALSTRMHSLSLFIIIFIKTINFGNLFKKLYYIKMTLYFRKTNNFEINKRIITDENVIKV